MDAMNLTYPPGLVAAIEAQEIADVQSLDTVRPEVADERTEGYAQLRNFKGSLQRATRDFESSEASLAKGGTLKRAERPWGSNQRRSAKARREAARDRVRGGAHLDDLARRNCNYIRMSVLQREVKKREAALVGVESCPVKSTARVGWKDLAAAAAARGGAGQ